ncbi:hypothetical protein GOV05_05340 [Candidatus Woesearchaeota archaeon]|nr:hypothetical protein [Candidatus Woesearchaeota archaeon]
MHYAHSVSISVFVKEDDNFDELKETLLFLVPFSDLLKEKIVLKKETVKILHDRNMVVLGVDLTKKRHTEAVINHLMRLLSVDQKSFLLRTLPTRVDDRMNFFFRLDKKKLVKRVFEIVDGSGCFHIKINLAAYPAKLEVAKKIAEKILK